MSEAWQRAESAAITEHFAALRALADTGCRICYGQGTTRGYISPGKYATYACPCTGQADFQREASDES